MSRISLTRRSFLAATASGPLLAAAARDKRIPIGLELYSVRDQLSKDLDGTVKAVAKMGYQDVEFYSPYFGWTPDRAKAVRKLLDDLGIRCLSTHNDSKSFDGDGMSHAMELNHIIGSRYIVMAHPGEVAGLDGYKKVAEKLNKASEKFKTGGMRAGYHNHDAEWKAENGVRPMDVLAKSTDKDVALQFDVGTCLEMKQDPIAWIKQNPGRIKSMHCKDWSPDKGYRVLFGEGVAPWKEIFAAAEKSGGVEFYLIEQEGSDYPPLDTAARCLQSFQQMRAS